MVRRKKYDERLEAVLRRLIRARITLSQGKCEFSRKQLKFAGHSFSAQGMAPIQTRLQLSKRWRDRKMLKIPWKRSSSKPCPRRLFLFAIFFRARTNGIGLRRMLLSLKKRNNPSASSGSLLPRKRNCDICRRLVERLRSSSLTCPTRWHKEANCLRFALYNGMPR